MVDLANPFKVQPLTTKDLLSEMMGDVEFASRISADSDRVHRIERSHPDRRLLRWLTRDEAAAYLRVSPRTISKLAEDGRIGRYKIGASSPKIHTVYDLAELDSLVVRFEGPGEKIGSR